MNRSRRLYLEGIRIEEVCLYDVGAKMFARPGEANITADYPARAMPKLQYIYTIEIRSESRREAELEVNFQDHRLVSKQLLPIKFNIMQLKANAPYPLEIVSNLVREDTSDLPFLVCPSQLTVMPGTVADNPLWNFFRDRNCEIKHEHHCGVIASECGVMIQKQVTGGA